MENRHSPSRESVISPRPCIAVKLKRRSYSTPWRWFQFNKTRILYLGGECLDPRGSQQPRFFHDYKNLRRPFPEVTKQIFVGIPHGRLHTRSREQQMSRDKFTRWPYAFRWIYVNRRNIRPYTWQTWSDLSSRCRFSVKR